VEGAAEKPDLFYKETRGRSFEARFDEIGQVVDLRRSDHLLDVGCAEGLITLEAAKVVERVHGIDIEPSRIAEATRLAGERGVENATFELASVIDYPFEPRSYDVSLFLAVWGKTVGEDESKRWVGADELRGILDATRRQLVMRVSVQQRPKQEPFLEEILDVCEQSGFDALCFSRTMPRPKPSKERRKPESAMDFKPGGNLLIANRRGTDARVGQLPRLVLMPTSWLPDHPLVRSSDSAPRRAGVADTP
jgi:SAM-dependent methyltransferase